MRENVALEYRIQGHPLRVIATQLGISIEGARQCIIRARKRLEQDNKELAEELRFVNRERIERIIQGHLTKATKGGIAATYAVLAAIARESAMEGLDAARRLEHTGPGGLPIQFVDLSHLTEEELDVLERALKKNLAEGPTEEADAGLGGSPDNA